MPGPRIEQCPQPYGYILSDQSTLLVLSQTEPAHRELEQEGKWKINQSMLPLLSIPEQELRHSIVCRWNESFSEIHSKDLLKQSQQVLQCLDGAQCPVQHSCFPMCCTARGITGSHEGTRETEVYCESSLALQIWALKLLQQLFCISHILQELNAESIPPQHEPDGIFFSMILESTVSTLSTWQVLYSSGTSKP